MLRLRSGFLVLGAAVALLLPAAPTMAGGCNLIATAHGGSPASVHVGDVVSLEGFVFAPGDVVLVFSVNGAELRTETVTATDAFGNVGYFILDVTPQAGEEGVWRVVGTESDAACSAFTGFPVAAAPAPTSTAAVVISDVATTPPGGAFSLASVLGSGLLLAGALLVLRRAGGPPAR